MEQLKLLSTEQHIPIQVQTVEYIRKHFTGIVTIIIKEHTGANQSTECCDDIYDNVLLSLQCL